MQSEHPGGYDDVAAFMKGNVLIPDASGRTFEASEIIDRYSPGIAASMIHNSLLVHGWYVPGDPEWLQPCSEWSK